MRSRRVLLPRHNEADLEDVPEELQRDMEFVPVDSASEVLAEALGLLPASSATALTAGGDGARTAPPR